MQRWILLVPALYENTFLRTERGLISKRKYSLIAGPLCVTYMCNCRGLFTWNNQRLLNFEAGVLDHAAPASVVIWLQGVQGADGTDRL